MADNAFGDSGKCVFLWTLSAHFHISKSKTLSRVLHNCSLAPRGAQEYTIKLEVLPDAGSSCKRFRLQIDTQVNFGTLQTVLLWIRNIGNSSPVCANDQSALEVSVNIEFFNLNKCSVCLFEACTIVAIQKTKLLTSRKICHANRVGCFQKVAFWYVFSWIFTSVAPELLHNI